MSDGNQHPSPFYRLLEGAVRRTLVYPVNADGEGPIWDDEGHIKVFENGEEWEYSINLVSLGDGKFRLAENPFFHGPNTLHWGDEIYALENEFGSLTLEKISVPLIYEHKLIIGSGPLKSNDPLSEYVHKHEGGWEAIAGGYLILTIRRSK